MPYSLYLRRILAEQRLDVPLDALDALAFGEIDLAALREHRIDEPGVHAQQLGELLGHLLVALEVVALAPHRPAGMQRRQQVLLVQVVEHPGQPGRQVVVEQDGAGVEVLQAQAPAIAQQRLHREVAAVRQRDARGLGDGVVERAQAHVQAGLVEDLHQALHVREIERVARVLLRDEQQVLGFRADLLDGRHRGLHRQRQHLEREVVPAAGEEIGVHRRELVAGVAQVDRAVERRRVLHPLEPEPALDGRHRLQDALLELVDRAGERGDEVRDHGANPGVDDRF